MIKIVDFKESYIEAAAELFVKAFKKQRSLIPELPYRHEIKENIIPLIKDMAEKCPGVAALENGKFVGYLTGYLIPEFKGIYRGTVGTEYAHGAEGGDRASIYDKMYSKIAETWVSNGYFTHGIVVPAYDNEIINTWFQNGFGSLCIDAIRSVEALGINVPEGIEIIEANTGNMEDILILFEEHSRYMAEAPTFLPLLGIESTDDVIEFLEQPESRIWLSFYRGKLAGYIKVQSRSFGAAHIVTDDKTIAITGAFVRKELRGKGIASALLENTIDWAKNNGYERVSVDFESANILGRSFWLKYFTPVTRSFTRHIDERMAWGHSRRDTRGIYY